MVQPKVLVPFLILPAIAVASWNQVRSERLPGELRVVNEGIAHDNEHWYFTNKRIIYQTTVNPISIEQANYHAIPEELVKQSYDHIGDIDIVDGILYGGMEAKNVPNGILAAWNTSDLSLLRYHVTEQDGMPWVAADATSRLLYSAVWNACCNVEIYDMDTFEHVGVLSAPEGVNLPKEVQGGAFYEGDLYLATNIDDAVWKMNISTGELTQVISDVYDHHEYEMEGITFWDLRSKGLGVMHIFGNFMQIREKEIRNYSPDSDI